MEKYFRFKSLIYVLLGVSFLFGQDTGESLFKRVCVACHTIGQGKLIGPDLADVHNRRSEEWIIKFVQSSQSVIKSGDPVATALFEEYNKIPMPDNPFSVAEVRSIISYIAANSPGGPGEGISPISNTTEEEIIGDSRNGEKLFEGDIRFTNNGPNCIICHHVKNDNVTAGASLAIDLTDVNTRLKEAGVQAILGNPPFPAMSQAYKNNPLTKTEIANLGAFLKQVDEVKDSQKVKRYGFRLLFWGLGGAVFLLFVFGGLWGSRKKKSVNHEIYERQIKSI
ncbi:MAG: cytochrome c [Calditrichaeota bacterium]|nr:MAG: cytochrome c [Calditrichota bacterium]MBL1205149.1 cytochrome c [Calditrichota bacterium]NOG44979.1 cytochrome c [Calditrichota bacterium]